MDVDKCIYSDDAVLPAYENNFLLKPNILLRLLDGKWLEMFLG